MSLQMRHVPPDKVDDVPRQRFGHRLHIRLPAARPSWWSPYRRVLSRPGWRVPPRRQRAGVATAHRRLPGTLRPLVWIRGGFSYAPPATPMALRRASVLSSAVEQSGL